MMVDEWIRWVIAIKVFINDYMCPQPLPLICDKHPITYMYMYTQTNSLMYWNIDRYTWI